MNCAFCPYPLRKDRGITLEEENVKGIIDSIEPDQRFKYICFSQFNEPLMDKRIFDYIDYARRRGFKVLIGTNGIPLKSERVLEDLLRASPDFIKISLQNIDGKQFDSSRGAPISFEEYKRIIFRFLDKARNSSSRVNIDIAFNFLSRGTRVICRTLGLEMGDPSITDLAEDLKPGLRTFLLC